MKIVGYTPLHYGKEYLTASVASVAPYVDKIYMLYTPTPSYGFGTSAANPDTEEELRKCVEPFAAKVEWHKGQWGTEGNHRDTIYSLAADADLIVATDADEVWEPSTLEAAIRTAYDGSAARYGVSGKGWYHFYRSFAWACQDVWAPTRLLKPKGNGNGTVDATIYHFGYAQSVAVTKYKWEIHGHKSELRPEWFSDIFLANRRTDCHPVVRNGWWNAQPFDKRVLPNCLYGHPYYERDVIE